MGTCNDHQPKVLPMKAYSIPFLVAMIISFISCTDSGDSAPRNSTGKGGSMARFAITATHVYTVDAENLHVYEIAPNGAVEKVNQVTLNGAVETIFALGSKLYFGTASSMLTYDISNPAEPTFDSEYVHFTACDPVVVQDTIAYVTVRSSGCRGGSQNVLDIINVKDPANPQQLSTTSLTAPFGLGIDGKTLFVCEGEEGLTVLDVSNPRLPVIKAKIKDGHTYDVIPNEGVLIVTGNDGIRQYAYSGFDLQLLSTIGVEK